MSTSWTKIHSNLLDADIFVANDVEDAVDIRKNEDPDRHHVIYMAHELTKIRKLGLTNDDIVLLHDIKDVFRGQIHSVSVLDESGPPRRRRW